MWLKRLVGVVMIITLLGMNTLVVYGLIAPEKQPPTIEEQAPPVEVPTVTLKADPTSVAALTTSALSWSTTGNPTECVASGAWTGEKTPFGAESTGRIKSSGNYTYTLTCKNSAGSAEASATITVGDAVAPKTPVVSSSKPSTSGASYCSGRTPCYGPKDVAAHSGAGNCWGWNIDRVINISGFDAAYHQVKSGISSIQVSGVCGKDLGPSLSGSVSAEGQTRNHNQSTKTNGDKNMAPYFVGYFDASK